MQAINRVADLLFYIKLQGYAAEMDNPAMAHLIPSNLLNKKDVLFGNMSEIYQFHKRFASFKQLSCQEIKYLTLFRSFVAIS